MEEERYADFIAGVTLTGPLVRLDLASLSATEKDDKGQPRPVVRQRIVMPVEGFVRSFGAMAQAMAELEKQGVIRRGSAPATGDTGGGGTAVPPPPAVFPPKLADFK